MGESKRKTSFAANEKHIASTAAALSAEVKARPDMECAQFLVVRLDQAEEATNALGGLPKLCREYLDTAAAMNRDGPSEKKVDAVCWELWPSGRQAAQLCSDFARFIDLCPAASYFVAASRGFGIRIVSFPGVDVSRNLSQVHEKYSSQVREVVDLISVGPSVELESIEGVAEVMLIPRITNELSGRSVLAQVLRHLDVMAANSASMNAAYANVLLSFDGYDDDPLQVWEFEHNVTLMRELDTYAPWWPWFTHNQNALVWFGALSSTGPTFVTSQMKVAFPFERDAVQEMLQARMYQCIQYLHWAGAASNSPAVQTKLGERIQLFYDVLAQVERRRGDVEAARMQVASEEGLLRFGQNVLESLQDPPVSDEATQAGPSGSRLPHQSDAKRTMGLLDLAIDPGGKEVDLDDVQILDEAVFGKVVSLGMRSVAVELERVKGSRSGGGVDESNVMTLQAWQREDGSLLIREQDPPFQEVIAPPGSWRLLDDKTMAEASAAKRVNQSESDMVVDWLADMLTVAGTALGEKRRSFEKAADRASSAVVLFDRSASAMRMLVEVLGEKSEVVEAAESWMASGDLYLLFFLAQNGKTACLPVADDAELLSGGLPNMLAMTDSPGTSLLVCATTSETNQAARKLWQERGGLVEAISQSLH